MSARTLVGIMAQPVDGTAPIARLKGPPHPAAPAQEFRPWAGALRPAGSGGAP